MSETDRKRASARFRRTMPLAFDYGHWSIKEPEDHDDSRYKALARDVQKGAAGRFHRICVDLESDREDVREQAAMEFTRRYERTFRRRLLDAGVDVDKEPARYRSYLRVIVRSCRRKARVPCDVANAELAVLIERELVGGGQ